MLTIIICIEYGKLVDPTTLLTAGYACMTLIAR